MKKTLLLLIASIFSISAYGADFVITVQSGGAKSWKMKVGSTVVAAVSFAKNTQGFYTTSDGIAMNSLNINAGVFQRSNQVYFESSDCTGQGFQSFPSSGTPYYMASPVAGNPDVYKAEVALGNAGSKVRSSALSGTGCIASSGTEPTTVLMNLCTDCIFNANTVFTFSFE